MSRCAKCGTKLEPDDDFCPNCGAKKGEAAPTTTKSSKTENKGSSKVGKFIIIGLVILFILAIIGAAIYYIMTFMSYETYEHKEFLIEYPKDLDYCDATKCLPDHPEFSSQYKEIFTVTGGFLKTIFTNPDIENPKLIMVFALPANDIQELTEEFTKTLEAQGLKNGIETDVYTTGGKIIIYYNGDIRTDVYLIVKNGQGYMITFQASIDVFDETERDEIILSFKPRRNPQLYH